ncbi:hypothetical protein CR513_21496, partial [Mucuna pruriens]
MQSAGFRNIPFQTIPNPKGGVSIVTLKLPQYSLCHSQSRDRSMPSTNQKSTLECSNRLESSYYPFPPGQSQQGNSRLMRTC